MLQTGKMESNNNNNKRQACPDCYGLKYGTTSSDRPHKFLVLMNQSNKTGHRTYRCSVCKTELTAKQEGLRFFWR